jgi:hypothetical protein
MNQGQFNVGDRVRLSESGRRRFRLSPARTGVVLGPAKSSTQCRVQWDGVKLQQVIHRSYLERDEPSYGRSPSLSPAKPDRPHAQDRISRASLGELSD